MTSWSPDCPRTPTPCPSSTHGLSQERHPERLTELTSQIFRVLSSEAETRRLESDDQATSDMPWGAKTQSYHLDGTDTANQQRADRPPQDKEAYGSTIQTLRLPRPHRRTLHGPPSRSVLSAVRQKLVWEGQKHLLKKQEANNDQITGGWGRGWGG